MQTSKPHRERTTVGIPNALGFSVIFLAARAETRLAA
jgi:hypothetical protein